MASTDSEVATLTDEFIEETEQYDQGMGTATRAVARHIVSELLEFSSPKPIVCDNACGTGAVTQALLDAHPQVHVVATDEAPEMITFMEQMIERNNWKGRVEAEVADCIDLCFPDDHLDANVMNFGIDLNYDPRPAVNEMYRTLKKGGIAVVTSWKDSAQRSIMFDVQALIKPAEPLSEPTDCDKIEKKASMGMLMLYAGFDSVTVENVSVVLGGASMSQLVGTVVNHIRSATEEYWTEEEKSKIQATTEKVLTEQKAKYLVIDTDDTKGIPMTAWVVHSRK